jgi:hypothetical protein
MPFTVKYGDKVVIEVPTVDDLEAVLAAIDKRGCPEGSPTEQARGTVSDRMGELLDRLSEEHLMLLTALSGRPAGIDSESLRVQLTLPSKRNIGGLLMGITKKARKLGLDMDKQIVSKRIERSTIDGERAYTYRIRADALQALKNREMAAGASPALAMNTPTDPFEFK